MIEQVRPGVEHKDVWLAMFAAMTAATGETPQCRDLDAESRKPIAESRQLQPRYGPLTQRAASINTAASCRGRSMWP